MVFSSFPYGVITLVVVYAAFAIPIDIFAPKCISHEPCNSGGVDNTTAGWATDFFISFIIFLLAIHLLYNRLRQVNRIPVLISGIVLEMSMAMGYIFGGIAHVTFPFNGAGDDGEGMLGFYITWFLSFLFLTLSGICQYLWVQQMLSSTMIKNPNETIVQSCCCCGCCNARKTMSVIIVINIVAFIMIATGCFWCIPVNVKDNGNDSCLVPIIIGEGIWYISYASLFIPWSFLVVRNITQSATQTVLGLNTTLAATALPVVQFTIGYMYIVWIYLFAIILGIDTTDLYADAKGAIVYHFGVLLTMFLTHNLVLTYNNAIGGSSSSNQAKIVDEETPHFQNDSC